MKINLVNNLDKVDLKKCCLDKVDLKKCWNPIHVP